MMGVGIGLARFRQPFNPGSIFANGELGEFWAPSPGLVFLDTARASPAAAGQAGANATGLFRGLHASQATVAFRPIFGREPEGGARNRLVQTEDVTVAPWVSAAGPSTVTLISPTQLGFPGFNQSRGQSVTIVGGAPVGSSATYSVELSGSGTIWIGVARSSGGVYEETRTRITLTETPTRHAVTHTIANAGQNGFVAFISRASDGTATLVNVFRSRLGLGTTDGPYQRVGAAFDTTEAGKADRWFLRRDPVDDALVATLPDLGSNATRAFVTEAGVTIQTGQTIGAGPYDILRAERLFGHLVINRPLTATETERVTRYLERLAP